jgi:hypothetical protein
VGFQQEYILSCMLNYFVIDCGCCWQFHRWCGISIGVSSMLIPCCGKGILQVSELIAFHFNSSSILEGSQ